MPARARFILAVIVLFLLMTGPFLLTALIVWVETEGEGRTLLVNVLAPHVGLGTLLTALGFAAGVGVVRTLFRQYVQGLLRMSENLRLMLGHGGQEGRFEIAGPDLGKRRQLEREGGRLGDVVHGPIIHRPAGLTTRG